MAAPERALAGEMTGTWALKIMTRRGTQREPPQRQCAQTALTYTGAVHLAVPRGPSRNRRARDHAQCADTNVLDDPYVQLSAGRVVNRLMAAARAHRTGGREHKDCRYTEPGQRIDVTARTSADKPSRA